MARLRSSESLLREHVEAFNSGDLRRTMAGLAANVIWATGTDLIRGKDDVEKFLADAMQAIGPMLEIRTIVSAPKRVAIEMRERYTVAGDQREAAIAAFYDIDDGQITRVKVYREGSAEA
jgi:uncharacterized protein